MKRFTLIYIICACAVFTSHAQELSDFLPSAKSGEPLAQYNAAQCYFHGWGTEINRQLGMQYLRLAAEGELPQAQSALATRYEKTFPLLADYWRGTPADSLPYRYHYRSYDNGCYYGEIRGGTRDGYGTFLWDSGTSHTGSWEEGDCYGMGYTRFADQHLYCNYTGDGSGYGALILADTTHHFSGAIGATRYVGYLVDATPNGFGTLYGNDGHLLYFGEFRNGHPTATYPSTENYSSYRWVVEHLNGGDTWEGESVGGIRNGFGIYRWADGSWWFGFWRNGLREGEGLYVRYDGAIMTGYWLAGELQE